MRPSFPPGDPSRRTIDAPRICDMLLREGWVYELRAGQRASAEAEVRAALERLLALGLPHERSASGGGLFDPVEVMQFLHWAAEVHGDRLFEDRLVATGRRLVLEVPSGSGPLRYGMTLRRRFNLPGRAAGSRISLRLPLPLEDMATRNVVTAFLPDPAAETKARFGPASLDVQAIVPMGGLITIGFSASFTVAPALPQATSARLEPAETALYTRPSEGLIKVSDRVMALAAQLAGAETDTMAILRRFWLFMIETLASGPVDYARIDPERPVDFILDQGWYDCRTGSALVVSLCRSLNIPARLVSGYCIHPVDPLIHTWFEVWVEGQGWLPFDLLCSDLSLSGRDPAWRDLFFGQITERVALERPPRLFAGGGAIRLPHRWHLLSYSEGQGSRFDFLDVDTGALIYSDHVEVVRRA